LADDAEVGAFREAQLAEAVKQALLAEVDLGVGGKGCET
jgi:hypothetical protein